MKPIYFFLICFFGLLCLQTISYSSDKPQKESLTPSLEIDEDQPLTDEEKLLSVAHSISSNTLYEYVKELCSEKYGGRLTGTQEYNECAKWVASHFEKWGLKPAGDNGTYLQSFPISYTLVFPGSEVCLHVPYNGSVIKKYYRYEDEFIPGATSGSGEITAEVVYVGYGITAPELGYDDYKGVDVKGRIILMEREVPASIEETDPNLFIKWRPYSFHQYKLKNAVAHGARGMLYNYGPIANPNNAYDKSLIYSHVGSVVVEDLFAGTAHTHKEVIKQIADNLKPQSFATGKTVTIKNITEHHPKGTAYNVIGIVEGSDPRLKDEAVIIGGHLDHLGRCYELCPGANDNASAVAIVLTLAEALTKSPVKPRRSIIFLCFGAEEQGVLGSKYYVEHPVAPLERTVGFINLDGIGCGDKLTARAAKNYPSFWEVIDKYNQKYVHQIIRPGSFINIARPRVDASHFMWKGVPSITFKAFGTPSYYHTTKDTLSIIAPETIEGLAQLLFFAVLDVANQEHINFRKDATGPLLIPKE